MLFATLSGLYGVTCSPPLESGSLENSKPSQSSARKLRQSTRISFVRSFDYRQQDRAALLLAESASVNCHRPSHLDA
jgi:hypothetical protein